MRDFSNLITALRIHEDIFNQRDAVNVATLYRDAADAIEELLAAAPTLKKLVNILSRYFNIGDSYTYELTRVKEAFGIGTMSFDDFSEWGEENVSDLAEYIIKNLFEPPKEDVE